MPSAGSESPARDCEHRLRETGSPAHDYEHRLPIGCNLLLSACTLAHTFLNYQTLHAALKEPKLNHRTALRVLSVVCATEKRKELMFDKPECPPSARSGHSSPVSPMTAPDPKRTLWRAERREAGHSRTGETGQCDRPDAGALRPDRPTGWKCKATDPRKTGLFSGNIPAGSGAIFPISHKYATLRTSRGDQ